MLPAYSWLDESCCYDASIYDTGWNAVIRDLLGRIDQELRGSHARLEVRQLKEKLGKLRMYYTLHGATRLQEAAVVDAYEASERRSAITCIECGARGLMRAQPGCVVPLCDRHA